MDQYFVAIIRRRWQWPFGLFLLVVVATAAVGDPRTWSDTTGSYQVDAEFVELRQGNVVLRRTDGQEIAVPLERLSKAD